MNNWRKVHDGFLIWSGGNTIGSVMKLDGGWHAIAAGNSKGGFKWSSQAVAWAERSLAPLYRAHAVDDDNPERYGFKWDPLSRWWVARMARVPDDLPFDVEVLKETCYVNEAQSPEVPDGH